MARRGLAIVLTALTVAACGAGNSVPETPTISAARSCLQRHGMNATAVPMARVRSTIDSFSGAAMPIAELNVVRRARVRTRLLIAYFRTAAAADRADSGLDPNAPIFVGTTGLEVQQASSGRHSGRVLVIEFNGRADNQDTLFAARYCTTGVPIPTPANP